MKRDRLLLDLQKVCYKHNVALFCFSAMYKQGDTIEQYTEVFHALQGMEPPEPSVKKLIDSMQSISTEMLEIMSEQVERRN